jgi:putative transposase
LAYFNTDFAQLLKLVPRHQIEVLAKAHHMGWRFRNKKRRSQFLAAAMGQLAGHHSLRAICQPT